MKKFFYLLLVVTMISVLFPACNSKPVTTTTITTKTTVTEPSSEGFLVSKQIVVKGNTVWGFSEKIYGTGTKWREVVAQNPFLQQPGRVYYDDSRKMWIVLIYPGEILKIGNEIVTPSYTVEETTTTTTSEPSTVLASVPWWGWLLIGLAVLLILFFPYLRNGFRDGWNNNSSSTVHVHIGRHGNIDQATDAAIVAAEVERSYRFRERVAEHMFTNPNLTRATMTENSNQTRDFIVTTEYQVR